jgi:hypothetical protein
MRDTKVGRRRQFKNCGEDRTADRIAIEARKKIFVKEPPMMKSQN